MFPLLNIRGSGSSQAAYNVCASSHLMQVLKVRAVETQDLTLYVRVQTWLGTHFRLNELRLMEGIIKLVCKCEEFCGGNEASSGSFINLLCKWPCFVVVKGNINLLASARSAFYKLSEHIFFR